MKSLNIWSIQVHAILIEEHFIPFYHQIGETGGETEAREVKLHTQPGCHGFVYLKQNSGHSFVPLRTIEWAGLDGTSKIIWSQFPPRQTRSSTRPGLPKPYPTRPQTDYLPSREGASTTPLSNLLQCPSTFLIQAGTHTLPQASSAL